MLFGKVLMHHRLWGCFKAKVVTTLPDGQCYETIVNQNTILETIVYNDIVFLLSMVNNIYTHCIVMCIVCYLSLY